jgi:hypothetical protein
MLQFLLTFALIGVYGCATTNEPPPWTQSGKTTQEVQADYAHCEKVSQQESQGMRSTDPFKEDFIKDQCMRKLGYAHK